MNLVPTILKRQARGQSLEAIGYVCEGRLYMKYSLQPCMDEIFTFNILIMVFLGPTVLCIVSVLLNTEQ